MVNRHIIDQSVQNGHLLLRVSEDIPLDWNSYQSIDNSAGARLSLVFDELDFSQEDIDPLGVCYNLLNRVEKRYLEGIFFTPPQLARFAVENLGPWRHDRILDLGSGTGVFLKEVADYLENRIGGFNRYYIWGVEKDPLLCSLSRSLRGHQATILFGDALDKDLVDLPESSFDIVFSNPPYAVPVNDTLGEDYDNLYYSWK